MLFNLTVSHANGSIYDARNLTVTDSTQGMDFYDTDISTKGAFVTYPKKNHFGVRFTFPGLRGKFVFLCVDDQLCILRSTSSCIFEKKKKKMA